MRSVISGGGEWGKERRKGCNHVRKDMKLLDVFPCYRLVVNNSEGLLGGWGRIFRLTAPEWKTLSHKFVRLEIFSDLSAKAIIFY